jgi:hypothetical protein
MVVLDEHASDERDALLPQALNGFTIGSNVVPSAQLRVAPSEGASLVVQRCAPELQIVINGRQCPMCPLKCTGNPERIRRYAPHVDRMAPIVTTAF